MYTTYHFQSAADITVDVLNAIKNVFKEKPVVITVEEESTYITGEESLNQLNKKYGL